MEYDHFRDARKVIYMLDNECIICGCSYAFRNVRLNTYSVTAEWTGYDPEWEFKESVGGWVDTTPFLSH